jgi:Zn-dependent peptidase ImmA (M78 family)/DNA-binding XRE family transcriptional regulator
VRYPRRIGDARPQDETVSSSEQDEPRLDARIGERIRRAREARNISQADLARELGLSQAAISNIETGTRTLRVPELIQISRLVGEDFSYFVVPALAPRRAVGVTLRAEAAQLPLPDFKQAIDAFLDEIEDAPLPDARFAVAERKPEAAAREVLLKASRKAPPTDVLAIARDLGVAVYLRPFPAAVSALLFRYEDSAFIGVNSHQAGVRQRFSIAHELGHFVLHHDDAHFIDYGVPTMEGEAPHYNWQDERAANAFAAELLMPEASMRHDAGTISAARLARRYEVSPEAMGFRLANLGFLNRS